MLDNELEVLQVNAISQLNFVYEDLKLHPPLVLNIVAPGENYLEKLTNMLCMMNEQERKNFDLECREHIRNESLTEAKKMLIINYLYALLVNAKNNQISIYKNKELDQSVIEQFAQENATTVDKIKMARDKVYAHLDLDWMNRTEIIEYDEIERSINFLNFLFGINVDDYK